LCVIVSRLRPIPVLGIGIGPIPVVRFGIGIADTAADTRRPSRLCNDSKRCCWLFTGSRKRSYLDGGVST